MLTNTRLFYEIYHKCRHEYYLKFKENSRYYTSRHTGKKYYLVIKNNTCISNIPNLINLFKK